MHTTREARVFLGLFASLLMLTGCHKGNGEGFDVDQNSISSCECSLDWQVDNTAICGGAAVGDGNPLVFSTSKTGDIPKCDAGSRTFPQPMPTAAWSKQRIRSEPMCAGTGRLCVTLRNGNWKEPTAADCVLATQCLDYDYAGSGEYQELPELAPWTATDLACATKYAANGGYLEFVNESPNVGCQPNEKPSVTRIRTCPIRCTSADTDAECMECTADRSSTLDTSI